MNRRNILLAVLLVIQLGVTAVLYWPGRQDVGTGTEERFFDLTPEQVTRMVITDRNDKKLTLQREGDAWLINPPDDFPGNRERVSERLKQLLTLTSDRLVSRTKAGHARLRVGDKTFNRRIEIVGENDKPEVIFLGTSQGQNGLHVRRGDSDDVYFVRGISVWDYSTSASQWWNNRYVDVEADDLTAVTIVNEHGTVALVRNDKGQWVFNGSDTPQPDQAKARQLVDKARTITITEYPPKDKRRSPDPVVTLTLATKDSPSLTFEIGKENDKGAHLIQGGKNKIPALVSKENVAQLFSITKDELAPKEEKKGKEAAQSVTGETGKSRKPAPAQKGSGTETEKHQ